MTESVEQEQRPEPIRLTAEDLSSLVDYFAWRKTFVESTANANVATSESATDLLTHTGVLSKIKHFLTGTQPLTLAQHFAQQTKEAEKQTQELRDILLSLPQSRFEKANSWLVRSIHEELKRIGALVDNEDKLPKHLSTVEIWLDSLHEEVRLLGLINPVAGRDYKAKVEALKSNAQSKLRKPSSTK
ncbi:hypothetical protein M1563_01950 [Patescibacteria group bacterium]|nr:hypothetical protein [Patescibacteria group bacterium]